MSQITSSRCVTMLLDAERRALNHISDARKSMARKVHEGMEIVRISKEEYLVERGDLSKTILQTQLDLMIFRQQEREARVQRRINELEELVAKNKGDVIKGLLEIVYTAEPETHKNDCTP